MSSWLIVLFGIVSTAVMAVSLLRIEKFNLFHIFFVLYVLNFLVPQYFFFYVDNGFYSINNTPVYFYNALIIILYFISLALGFVFALQLCKRTEAENLAGSRIDFSSNKNFLMLGVLGSFFLLKPGDALEIKLSEGAGGSGVFYLLFQSFLIVYISCISRSTNLSSTKKIILLVFTGVLGFVVTATKALLVIPFFWIIIGKKISLRLIGVFIFLAIIILSAQLFRSELGEILISEIYNVVFDSFRNTLVILSRYDDFGGSFAKVLYEDILINPIPRAFLTDKEFGLGFWRIQEYFLYELDFGPFGASYSIGYPAYLFVTMGFWGLAVAFIFPLLLVPLERYRFYGIYYYSLLFLNEFFRGGIRSLGVYFVGFIIIFLIEFVIEKVKLKM